MAELPAVVACGTGPVGAGAGVAEPATADAVWVASAGLGAPGAGLLAPVGPLAVRVGSIIKL